jgi:hypothetical protein
VWQAIATGPGVSSWFVPTQIEGNLVKMQFGPGMEVTANVTAWDPPRRYAAESEGLGPGAPAMATEWIVEARGGGTCVVRVVHILFASTDDWDDQIAHTETGWPGYFRVLSHYVEHHAGEPSAAFVVTAPAAVGADQTWNTLSRALGAPAPRVGQAVRVEAPGGAAIAGTVQAVDDVPQGKGVMLVLREPAPGVALASAMDCMGMRMATLQAFYYGDRAAAAARDQPRWQEWLGALFPAAVETEEQA